MADGLRGGPWGPPNGTKIAKNGQNPCFAIEKGKIDKIRFYAG